LKTNSEGESLLSYLPTAQWNLRNTAFQTSRNNISCL